MHRFADEVLNQVRSLGEALADLLAKYERIAFDHPDRSWLEQMIQRLEAEIALREGRSFDRRFA